MAATVQLGYFGASVAEPTGAGIGNAEAGWKNNREDTQNGVTPIPIPQVAGTNFSAPKQLALNVTATSTTSISNRRVTLASAPANGMAVHALGATTYLNQQTTLGTPTAGGANGATPTGYTALSTYLGVVNAAYVWDAASVATSAAGRNGNFCRIVIGVDQTFALGAGNATATPSLSVSYDEA